MLERPDISDQVITAWLRDQYGRQAVSIEFLPLGADVHTSVFRVSCDDSRSYFLKVRQGAFDEISVEIPHLLHAQGIAQAIPPIHTEAGELWATADDLTIVLYPFVDGRDVYAVELPSPRWIELGSAFKRIHAVALPPRLSRRIARETYSPRLRDRVRMFQQSILTHEPADLVAARLAAFMRERQEWIRDLVDRAERLAHRLENRVLEPVLCHADLHAGNVLVQANGTFYIVDWDNPMLASKERDLMSIGGGLFANRTSPEEEERLFYQGYGETHINYAALAYYRYERIVEDIAAFCEQLLLSETGGADREQSLGYFTSSFLPDHVVDIAMRSDRSGDMLDQDDHQGG